MRHPSSPLSRHSHGLACVLAAGLLSLCAPAWAQSGDADQTQLSQQEARDELQAIKNSIELSEERTAELRTEMEELSGDRAAQNAALIAAAQRVKLAEIEVGAMEERMAELLEKEAAIRSRLDGADADVAGLLAGLQKIGQNPPPALIVNPSDALGAARSGMLLSSILPHYRERADQIVADLKQLVAVREAAQAEETELKANFATLFEEQLRIATLIEARKQGVGRVSAELEAEEEEARKLAEEASSLNQLIDTLAQRIESVGDAAAAAASLEGTQPDDGLSTEQTRLALADTSRTEPAFAFPQAKGHLVTPSAGVPVIEYGASDGFGGIAEGNYIVTRAEAQVVAPADGWVVYKGPYLNYGQIVIINPGQGYSILLAGLDTIDVDLGQFVLMGEPLGRMGSRTLGRTVTTSAGVSRPTLYIELRDENGPVDPTNWWAPDPNRTQSG